MTKPRRWPEHAETHRLEAIACLLDIQDWAALLDEAVACGRTIEARHLIKRIRRQAMKGQRELQEAGNGAPSPDRDVLAQVEDMLGDES